MSDPRLEIRALERELVVHEVDRLLLQLVKEAGTAAINGQVIDTMPYSRKVIAFLREHLV